MKRLRVEVTAEDIADGRREHCERCPVARAMRRAIGRVVWVGGAGQWGIGNRSPQPKRLPLRVTDFITAFDTGRPVSPFTFNLDVPEVK